VGFALLLRPAVMAAGQLSLVAIVITGWRCGLRPALLAWGLATLAFTYFFTPSLDSPHVDLAEAPRLAIFALLGLFMAMMSAARRRGNRPRRRRSAVQRLLHHQAERHGYGAVDQPVDHRGARRAALGDREPLAWCYLPVLARNGLRRGCGGPGGSCLGRSAVIRPTGAEVQ
jgi:hypothetical protein